jgi:hypothetical protein
MESKLRKERNFSHCIAKTDVFKNSIAFSLTIPNTDLSINLLVHSPLMLKSCIKVRTAIISLIASSQKSRFSCELGPGNSKSRGSGAVTESAVLKPNVKKFLYVLGELSSSFFTNDCIHASLDSGLILQPAWPGMGMDRGLGERRMRTGEATFEGKDFCKLNNISDPNFVFDNRFNLSL